MQLEGKEGSSYLVALRNLMDTSESSRRQQSSYINTAIQRSAAIHLSLAGVRKSHIFPTEEEKNIYFLKVTNELLQSFPADLTQKMYLKCQFKVLQRQVFRTGKMRLVTDNATGEKISAEKHRLMPLPWSGKQIMQKDCVI